MVAALIGMSLLRSPKKDATLFQKLMESSSMKKNHLLYTESLRSNVVKEVWFQEKERHQMRIHSKDSVLFFFNEGKEIEVVEQMGDVECLFQEKLFFQEGIPMQEVRFLKAKKGSYNYTTGLFIAENVFLSKYHLAGHALPKTPLEMQPLMQGKAEFVEFTLKGEKIDFKAHQFSATFDPKKGML